MFKNKNILLAVFIVAAIMFAFPQSGSAEFLDSKYSLDYDTGSLTLTKAASIRLRQLLNVDGWTVLYLDRTDTDTAEGRMYGLISIRPGIETGTALIWFDGETGAIQAANANITNCTATNGTITTLTLTTLTATNATITNCTTTTGVITTLTTTNSTGTSDTNTNLYTVSIYANNAGDVITLYDSGIIGDASTDSWVINATAHFINQVNFDASASAGNSVANDTWTFTCDIVAAANSDWNLTAAGITLRVAAITATNDTTTNLYATGNLESQGRTRLGDEIGDTVTIVGDVVGSANAAFNYSAAESTEFLVPNNSIGGGELSDSQILRHISFAITPDSGSIVGANLGETYVLFQADQPLTVRAIDIFLSTANSTLDLSAETYSLLVRNYTAQNNIVDQTAAAAGSVINIDWSVQTSFVHLTLTANTALAINDVVALRIYGGDRNFVLPQYWYNSRINFVLENAN